MCSFPGEFTERLLTRCLPSYSAFDILHGFSGLFRSISTIRNSKMTQATWIIKSSSQSFSFQLRSKEILCSHLRLGKLLPWIYSNWYEYTFSLTLVILWWIADFNGGELEFLQSSLKGKLGQSGEMLGWRAGETRSRSSCMSLSIRKGKESSTSRYDTGKQSLK